MRKQIAELNALNEKMLADLRAKGDPFDSTLVLVQAMMKDMK
jgi:hypothetical protein